jgi:hypothetical protein
MPSESFSSIYANIRSSHRGKMNPFLTKPVSLNRSENQRCELLDPKIYTVD